LTELKQKLSQNLCYNVYMETQTLSSVDTFVNDYNQLFNVPSIKASCAICNQYKNEHPNEFKTSDWSIDKHRKRFMDWMSGQRPEALEILRNLK